MKRTNKAELKVIQNVANTQMTVDDMKYLFDHQEEFSDEVIDVSIEKTGKATFDGVVHEWKVVRVLGIYFEITKVGQEYYAKVVKPTIFFDEIKEEVRNED